MATDDANTLKRKLEVMHCGKLVHPDDIESVSDDEAEFPVQKMRRLDTEDKTDPTPGHDGFINVNVLSEVIECGVCKDILLKPHITQCSHMFCKPCIYEWLRHKKSCPTCRMQLTREPIHSLPHEHIIEICIKYHPKEEQEAYKTRMASQEKDEEAVKRRFNKSVENSRRKGTKFLEIGNLWNEQERDVFSKGLLKHTGDTRLLYLALVNLDIAFIGRATKKQLENACKNLRFTVPREISCPAAVDYTSIQNSLRNFIENGVLY